MKTTKAKSNRLTASLKRVIEGAIRREVPEKNVCLFLSGGTDSTTVGFAAQALGKKITAISYNVEGIESWDQKHAETTARILGWNFHTVVIYNKNIKEQFLDLVLVDGCSSKTQVECMLPFKAMLKLAKTLGFKKILTGFNNPIPDGRKDTIRLRTDTEVFWEQRLKDAGEPDSLATQKMIKFANNSSIQIVAPLGQKQIVKLLYGLTLRELNSPYEKHHWKNIYRQNFLEVGLLNSRNTPGLQTGGHIERLFIPLLDDPEINFRNYQAGTQKSRLSSLCRAWSVHSSDRPQLHVKSRTKQKSSRPFLTYTVSHVHKCSNRKLFSVVSTFAGGGGSSTGYKLAGGDVIFANEFIPAAIETYKLNYPDTPIVSEDIRRINHGKESVERLFAKFGIISGQLDVFDGSPPCATFSAATAGRGEEKIKKKNVVYSDTRQNRVGMLIHDYVFMANVMKPKVCVIENVPRIKNSDVFLYALERIRRYGYLVNFKKLVSTDYGVPQKRERLFVLAIRPDVARSAGIKSEADVLNVFPEPFSNFITIKEALIGLEIDSQERDMLLTAARQGAHYEILKQLPFNPSKPIGISDVVPEWKSDFNMRRAAWNMPCPTITATGAQGRGGILHPEENRGFTINELKRLSSLPDDFKLAGTFAQKAERIGRMVPPLMTKALADSIYQKILSRSLK